MRHEFSSTFCSSPVIKVYLDNVQAFVLTQTSGLTCLIRRCANKTRLHAPSKMSDVWAWKLNASNYQLSTAEPHLRQSERIHCKRPSGPLAVWERWSGTLSCSSNWKVLFCSPLCLHRWLIDCLFMRNTRGKLNWSPRMRANCSNQQALNILRKVTFFL